MVRLTFREGMVAAGAAAVLTLSACAASPTIESSTTRPDTASAGAATTVTVSCEEFNAISTLDEAYVAMGSATGTTYTDAADHNLLQGAQNACSMDLSRTLNEVMLELTEGQVVAAASTAPTADSGTSSSGSGAGSVAEVCSFGSNEPYFTVEILSDFPDIWKSDAPLPDTGGNAVCHQLAPDTAQLDRYWVYFEDEQAGQAPATSWDAALTSAGYSKSCSGGDLATALQEYSVSCNYLSAGNQSASIDYDKGFGWQLWFLPHN